MEPQLIEERKSFLLAGLSERYNNQAVEGIPAQWQRFVPYIAKVPGQVGWTTYGVCFNMDTAGNMDYMCGVEVSTSSALPEGLSELRVAEQLYAVFFHRDHISKIRDTWDGAFLWVRMSGRKLVKAPQVEAYGEGFNAQTGNGGVEIWIPVER